MRSKNILCCALVVVIILSCCCGISADSSVDGGIVPYYVNVTSIRNLFAVSNGTAVIETIYNDRTGAFTSITVEVTLQKKVLLFWSDVDGGEWTTTRTASSGTISHSLALSKTGEYRAVITCTVYGTAGEPDVVTETLYYTYTN